MNTRSNHQLTCGESNRASGIVRALSHLSALILGAAVIAVPATADSPPDLPLPPCVGTGDQQTGACAEENASVGASAGGIFESGTTVALQTVPTDGACDVHNGSRPPFDWTPSPCFASVARPSIVSCGYIDLTDNDEFKEAPCASALYQNPTMVVGELFTFERPDIPGQSCGDAGNFSVCTRGSCTAENFWIVRAPGAVACDVTFNGPRPDGLFGPTWVKVGVAVGVAETGDFRAPGRSESAEIFIPIEGDLRELPKDVSVFASNTFQRDEDGVAVTLTATIENEGEGDVENMKLTVDAPDEIVILGTDDLRCAPPRGFVGSSIACNGLALNSGGIDFIDFRARVVNVADLEKPVTFTLELLNDEDVEPQNNSDTTRIAVSPEVSGDELDTHVLLDRLEPFFDFTANDGLLGQQCNVYMNDIYQVLETLRQSRPELFESLSFGRLTSGNYSPYTQGTLPDGVPGAGHVGVVVYVKGSDYRQTGVVIHGTPTVSPADFDPDTKLGTRNFGQHITPFFNPKGTNGHGEYYRTGISNFPGSPRPEPPEGCGFEGLYSDNEDTFDAPRKPNCIAGLGLDEDGVPLPFTCPIFPDAQIVWTRSPVDIRLTSLQGYEVVTDGDIVSFNEQLGGVFAWNTPHDDGSNGWLMAVPRDDYDIELIGNDDGPVTFTTITVDDTSDEEIINEYLGMVSLGTMDSFLLSRTGETSALDAPSFSITQSELLQDGDQEQTETGGLSGDSGDLEVTGDNGGGGSISPLLLLFLLVPGLRRSASAVIGRTIH